ncbi:hypothetical protein BH10PSE12_BH10PSE12_27770 [soil metagenome]
MIKTTAAVGMFAAVMTGWTYLQEPARDTRILPNAGGREGACVIWFVGSSTIHRWTTLATDMRPWITHNRGIDGATYDEIRHGFSNEGPVKRPQAIVLYVGENDIAFGSSAPDAVDDLRAFLRVKTNRMGDVPVFVISLKPSPTRWANLPDQTAFNVAARKIADDMRDVRYVDVVPLMLVNGRPGPFYAADGVHMSTLGYQLWSGVIRNALAHGLPRKIVQRCDPAESLG